MSGFDLTGCCALITGASAGIGREFARQLADRAGSLILVARRVDRLEALRAELTQKNPNLNVLCRAVDLSQPSDLENLHSWLDQENVAIDFLINNAGLGDHGPFATADPKRLQEMLDVNVVALTMLMRAFLPAMVAKKRGAILNVSSTAGFLPLRKMALYAASKSYVTSLSDGVGAEVRRDGIVVTSLCPGPVATEFNLIATRPGKRHRTAPPLMYVAIEQVVRAGLAGIERGKALVIPGVVMKIAMWLVRLTPAAILRRV